MVQPILDYASPQPKGKTRLPARSVLDLVERDGGVRVVESLTGKGEAIGAICFALFTMLMLFLSWWVDRHNRGGLLEGMALLEIVVMTLVINNTWRRTIVDANPNELRLEFRAPLWPRRRGFVWPASDVVSIAVPSWQSTRGGARDARIAIVIHDAPPVSLFDGHVEPQLTWIAKLMRSSLGLPN